MLTPAENASVLPSFSSARAGGTDLEVRSTARDARECVERTSKSVVFEHQPVKQSWL